MKKNLFAALKVYAIVTLVMVVNVALLWGVSSLFAPPPQPRYTSWQDVPGLEPAGGDKAKASSNLRALEDMRFKGMHANLRVILRYCGEPDGYAGDLHGDLALLYYWSRFGHKDWVAYVSLKGGYLIGVGYNGSSVNDHSGYKDWDIKEADIPTYQ